MMQRYCTSIDSLNNRESAGAAVQSANPGGREKVAERTGVHHKRDVILQGKILDVRVFGYWHLIVEIISNVVKL